MGQCASRSTTATSPADIYREMLLCGGAPVLVLGRDEVGKTELVRLLMTTTTLFSHSSQQDFCSATMTFLPSGLSVKTWDTPSHQPDKKLSWEEWQDEHSYNVTHFLATPTPPSVVKYQSGLTGHPTPKPRVFAARVICFLFDYWEVCTEKRRNIIKQKLASLISYLDKKPSPHVGRVVVVRLPAIRIPNRTDVIRDLSRAVGCSEPAVCLLPLENTSKHADCVRFLWHQFHIFRNKHPTTFNCGGVQLPCTACC